MFSHDENSAKYSVCDTKYGNCNKAYDVDNSGIEISSYEAANVEHTNDNGPWMNQYSNQCVKVLIENKLKPKSMSKWFYMLHKLESIEGLSNVDTSNCIDMSGTFCGCSSLENVDVSSFNTSNVETLYATFSGCKNLKQINGIFNFNTEKCIYFGAIFTDCESLTSIDVSNFNTRKAEYMSTMFSGCKKLTSLDLSSFYVPSNVSLYGFFQDCQLLTSVVYGPDFNKPRLYTSMFKNCPANKPSWW